MPGERLSFLANTCDCRQLGSLAGKLGEYEQLLEELSLRAGVQDRALIRRTLDRVKYLDYIRSTPADCSRSYRPRTLMNQQLTVAKGQMGTESRPESTRLALELVLPIH